MKKEYKTTAGSQADFLGPGDERPAPAPELPYTDAKYTRRELRAEWTELKWLRWTSWEQDMRIRQLKEELRDWITQHGCHCGHPACRNCEMTRHGQEVADMEELVQQRLEGG